MIYAAYSSGDSFFLVSDQTLHFTSGIRVLADCGVDGKLYGMVTVSCYDSDLNSTRVTLSLDSGSLTTNLIGVIPDVDTVAAVARQTVLSVLRDSLGKFPGLIAPSLNLFCGEAADTAPAGTFHRATLGTRYGQTGLIETVAEDKPRREWDQTGACMGWRIEGLRSNLIPYSTQIHHNTWSKSNVDISVDAVISPDGTRTADKLVENIEPSVLHYVTTDKFCTVTTGTVTFSIYAKAAERTSIQLYLVDSTGIVSGSTCIVDLTVGLVTFGNAIITDSGNGWYRICTSKTVNDGSCYARIFLHNGISTTFTGNGVSGLYIWGAQLEAAQFPSSFIPTAGGRAARAADVWSLSLAATWFRTSVGTIFLAGRTAPGAPAAGAIQILAQYDDGTADNCIRVVRNEHRALSCMVATAGSEVVALNLEPVADITDFRLAVSWSAFAFSGVLNGGACSTSTVTALPNGLSTHRIGSDASGGSQWDGHVFHDAYFPVALSDMDKIAITF